MSDLRDLEKRLAEQTDLLRELSSVVRDLRDRLPPLLVPIDDAANRLKVSTRTIRRWVKERRIPFVKLGNVVRIDLTDVRALKPVELEKRVTRARGV